MAINPMVLAAIIQGGGSLLGGLLGDKGGDEQLRTFMPKVEFLEAPEAKFRAGPKPEQYPEFPEAKQAREAWMGSLQEWGEQPGYGAIGPDWGDIWERSKKRVSEYYWGGPGGQPGLAGKVRGSAARRGVSQSPALETELSRMGMQEAGQLRDISIEQAIQEAVFGEQGRQSWLQNLQAMTGVRPRYYQPGGMWQAPYANIEQSMGYPAAGGEGPGYGELVSDLGGAGMKYAMQKQQQDWLKELLKNQGTGIPGDMAVG